ncbi:MAG: hypothetical protein GX558_06400, partial [Clostridiales bacterium]|nr:hypothetical protein [Clostridiales bacterium]
MKKINLKPILDRAWKIVGRNLGWKVTSVVFAFILWSFVLSSDTSTTRIVAVGGVGVNVTGQSVLDSRLLALLTDPAPLLTDV